MTTSTDAVIIDAESGGGQMVRNAVALAALARRPLRLENIRAGDEEPGLRQEHVDAVQLIAKLCGGRLTGATVGSTELDFVPGALAAETVTVDHGSESLTLLAQAVLPCLLFAPGPSACRARGGTDIDWSPPYDEFMAVFLPTLASFGADVRATLGRRGFDPDGGGELTLAVERPVEGAGLRPLVLVEQGTVIRVDGRAFATAACREADELPTLVSSIKDILGSALAGVPVEIQAVTETPETAAGHFSAVTLVATTSNGCRYGATHIRDVEQPATPEQDAQEVVKALAAQVRGGGCVDQFMQDQVVLYMALAKGQSKLRIGELTKHTKGAVRAARTLVPCSFKLEEDGATKLLICEGAGLLAQGKFATPSGAGRPAAPTRPAEARDVLRDARDRSPDQPVVRGGQAPFALPPPPTEPPPPLPRRDFGDARPPAGGSAFGARARGRSESPPLQRRSPARAPPTRRPASPSGNPFGARAADGAAARP
eukprot:EG_transcript_10096